MNDSEERFTALYDRHYRSVLGYVLLRSDPEVAEDVSSETFLVAWRRLDEMPDRALPWLLGVARNLLAKQRGKQQRGRALLDRITARAAVREHAGQDVADQVADRDAAVKALASMPEKDLEAMALATWHGLEPHEAATVMGCSLRAYHARLHRARKRLGSALARDAEPRPSPPHARSQPVGEI
ncbi:RNA polymerase sigma factor [Actinomadura darangshiensis]|uniref:RNA polymerase sigma factor n=1 Tax=Actinomadura darangshiensis TaxID=705336 RepID=UPI00140D55E7|nr:sigma-70 family RNA polymerase sigma factor [Actinomadura darangshiensis]